MTLTCVHRKHAPFGCARSEVARIDAQILCAARLRIGAIEQCYTCAACNRAIHGLAVNNGVIFQFRRFTYHLHVLEQMTETPKKNTLP